MAGGDINSFKNRSEGAQTPIPVFQLSALPDKLARIDPAGAAGWLTENNRRIADWVSKLNTQNAGVVASIPSS